MNCPDCGTWWDSALAASQCAVLDAAEAKAAQHPARDSGHHTRDWDDE